MLKLWLALNFKFSLNPQIDFAIWITHSLREGLEELAKLKDVLEDQQNQQPPKVEAWGIYSPLGKLAVAIPDTSGMTYTAPTVTKLQ